MDAARQSELNYNPYVTEKFTNDADSRHFQGKWILTNQMPVVKISFSFLDQKFLQLHDYISKTKAAIDIALDAARHLGS